MNSIKSFYESKLALYIFAAITIFFIFALNREAKLESSQKGLLRYNSIVIHGMPWCGACENAKDWAAAVEGLEWSYHSWKRGSGSPYKRFPVIEGYDKNGRLIGGPKAFHTKSQFDAFIYGR